MNPILRNVLAVIAGLIVGGVVNMALVSLGPMVIPPPEGIDMSNVESLKANSHLLGLKHFIFPWLAHALNALVGAFVCTKIAASHHKTLSLGIGGLTMIGGIATIMMIPAPMVFKVVDLAAYLPMAWLGWKLASR